MRGRSRRGAALVEVLIGAVILAAAGTALVTLLGQTRHTMRSVRDLERQIDSASVELDRLVVLDRAALAAREGWTQRGAWSVRVTRVSPTLFDVAVATETGGLPVLETTVYRPDTTNAR